LIKKGRVDLYPSLLINIAGETRPYGKYVRKKKAKRLTSIVLSNHPNSVDNAGNKAQKGKNQVDPKIRANPNCQKYAQRGKKNGSDYAN
jgi:hypothetical protein